MVSTATANLRRMQTQDELRHGAVSVTQESKTSNDSTATSLPAKVVHGHVRSGQQISSGPNQSLVILGSVHSGGEVLSDGDIHLYGKLKGRALAGLGTPGGAARIYVQSFDPELVCIDGTYTTIDDVAELTKGAVHAGDAVMVYLDSTSGELRFERMQL